MLFSPVEIVLESLCVGCKNRQGRSEDIAVVRSLQDFSQERRGGGTLEGRDMGEWTSRYMDAA